MTCRCHPNNRCGRCVDEWQAFCDSWVTAVSFAISELADRNPRRDDEQWNERIRLLAGQDDDSANAA